MTGQSQPIDALEIVLPSPELDAHYVGRRERGNADEWNRSLESADSIIGFRPEEIVGALAPKALLIVHGEADLLAPVSESQILYEKANEPKRLAIIPKADHVSLYSSNFEQSIETCRSFLAEFL
jgi:hypothetical protein